MSVGSADKTMGCAEVRPLLAKLWRRKLEAAQAEQVRKHLQACEACEEELSKHITASVLSQETRMPQHGTDSPSRAEALRGFVAAHQRQMRRLLSASPSPGQQEEPWAQDEPDAPDEMDAVRRAWQNTVSVWRSFQLPQGAGWRGTRAPTLGPDEEWPQQIDVPIASSSGQPHGRTVRFEVVEPPLVTPAGEFIATLRTDDAGFVGWSLRCTVTFAGPGKTTFAGTIQPLADGQGWAARLHASGLPRPESIPLEESSPDEDVVIPIGFVEWSLQERNQLSTQAVPGRAVLVGVNHYTDEVAYPPLRCSIRDTIGLYVVLTHPAHGALAPEQVTLLLDGTDAEVRLAVHTVVQHLSQEYGVSVRPGMLEEILDKRVLPEREEILAAVQSAARSATAEDLLVFSFAGYGSAANGELYLLPPRTRHPLYFWTAVWLDQVKDILRQSRARDTVCLLDASYAGVGTGMSPLASNEQLGEALFANTEDIALFASCLPGEQSLEQTVHDEPAGRPVHSLFATFLLEGLIGRADTESTGCVTLADLSRYVTDKGNTWLAAHDASQKSGSHTPSLRATHAQRIILSGDRSAAREEVTQTDRPAPAVMAARPLDVRVWIQSAAAPLRPASCGDAPQPRLADTSFAVQQPIRYGFATNRNAYLYLLEVNVEGTVTLRFPRQDGQENHVLRPQRYFLPGEHDAVASFPVLGPPGVRTLIAIATVQPAPILAEWQQAGQDTISVSVHDLARLRQALSPSALLCGQWALGQFQFVVREQG